MVLDMLEQQDMLEIQLSSLRARLAAIPEGKEHKRERVVLSKKIYALECSDSFITASKAAAESGKQAAKQEEDAQHVARLKEEEEKRQKMAEELAEKRQERISAEAEEAASSPVENHNTIKRIKKGDGATRLKHGDLVGVSFVGNFAAGTEHQGTEYGGSPFDTTIRPAAKPPHHKVDTPLVFRLGDGKAIRGMEECLKDMTLGERVEVTVGPKWAYKKGGMQNEKGEYIIPPYATLIFDLQLVRVADAVFESKPKSPILGPASPTSPKSTGFGFSSPGSSPFSSPFSSPKLGPSTPPRSPSLKAADKTANSPRSPKSPGFKGLALPPKFDGLK